MLKVKLFSCLSFTVILITAILSCNKPPQNDVPAPIANRQIQFELFSDTDLSGDNHNILFSVFIEHSRNRLVWDSVLPAMKVKDIPAAANKIIIQKNITGDTAWLKIGFRYAIEDVGYAGLVDTMHAGTAARKLIFNFR